MKFISVAIILLLGLINCFDSKPTSTCLDPVNWCKSIENALTCNVFDQCKQFIWRTNEPEFISNTNNVVGDLVNFTLYYETLCPDCREFVSTQLWSAFQSVGSIMNLTLVPYGNAKETYRQETKLWQFACQHGSAECWGNLLHSCLLKYFPQTENHLPFIHCMESTDNDTIQNVATLCSNKLNIPMDNLTNCMHSIEGNELQHANAVQTDNLNPKHTYVPWVTLNGVHNEDIQNKAQEDLVSLVCNTYQGTKPSGCNKKIRKL